MDFNLSSLALIRQDNSISMNQSTYTTTISPNHSFSDLLKGGESANQFLGTASITATIDKPITSIEESQKVDSKNHNQNVNHLEEESNINEEVKSSDLNQSSAQESNQPQEKFDLDTNNENDSEIKKKIDTDKATIDTKSRLEPESKTTDNKIKSFKSQELKINDSFLTQNLQFQSELTKSLGVSGSVRKDTAELVNSNIKIEETSNQKNIGTKSKGHKIASLLEEAISFGEKSGTISNVIQAAIGGKLLNDKSQSATTQGKAKIQDTKITHITTDKKNHTVSADNSNQIQATINASISKTEESINLQQPKDKLGLVTDKWNIVSVKANRTSTKSETSNSKSDNSETQFKNDNLFKTDLLRSFDKPATSAEIEKGVRQGFQDLIKKANVQIGTEGNASAQIRMNPDHLGFMSVDMKVEQNRVVLKILVDRQDVLEQLKKDIEILRGEFVKTGLQVDSVSLKLREPFETGFNSNSSDSKQTQANSFSSSSDKQESNQGFYNDESYFESTQSKSVESTKPETTEIELIPSIGQSHYESQLVMNLHNGGLRSSFTA